MCQGINFVIYESNGVSIIANTVILSISDIRISVIPFDLVPILSMGLFYFYCDGFIVCVRILL